MLRFQYTPDVCFHAIVDSALSTCADELREWIDEGEPEYLKPATMEHLCDWFESPILLTVLDRLLEAHRALELYSLNDWHYLILYHVLHTFVTVHNDFVRDTGLVNVGGSLVGDIEFDAIIEIYFWDIDFLTTPDIFNGIPRQLRSSADFSLEWIAEQGLNVDEVNNMDFSEELFGIVNRLAPHPDELELVRIGDDHARELLDWIFEAGRDYPYSPDE